MRRGIPLGGFAAVLLWVPELCAQSAPAAKKAPVVQRVDLFIGAGSAGWLPNSPVLPGAKEIEATAQKLGARLRNIDSFGLRTFPKEEEAVPGDNGINRVTEKVTLNQALQTLRVTGINLERKEVLLGARNVFQGDSLELFFKNEVFVAEVLEVTPSQILFRDRQRQETGVLALTLVHRLALEPFQKRPRESRLEGKITPMEPIRK
jgi:hypothetical protein